MTGRSREITGCPSISDILELMLLRCRYILADIHKVCAIPATTVIFKTNKTQVVRLPKDVAFPDDVREVEIIRSVTAA